MYNCPELAQIFASHIPSSVQDRDLCVEDTPSGLDQIAQSASSITSAAPHGGEAMVYKDCRSRRDGRMTATVAVAEHR
jgi:hypothetical protein